MKSSRGVSRGSLAAVCLVMMLAVVLVGGCKKEDAPIAGPPGDGGGGTSADSVRLAALASFEAYANSLDYSNPAVYAMILEYFRSHAETYEASDTAGPRGVWTRFTDGRLFIVSDNTEATSDTPGALLKAVGPLQPSRGPAASLPSSAQARLLNALGPAFDPLFGTGAQQTVTDLRNWFSAAGYASPPSGDASVDGLKLVQGDGVFYLSSHGSWGETRSGQTAYGIWTTDEVTPANETRLSGDLNSTPPRLCWYRALDNNSIFDANRKTHYAITADFVRTYMSFGTNSLVFFNACKSDDTDFKAACIAKQAGVYLGWTNNINGLGSLTSARFFFDRLLGAHQQPPAESPPQRPFEITYVMEDMLLRKLDVSTTSKGMAKLEATPLYGYGGEPTLLAPSIQWVIPPFIPGDEKILIDGSFGEDPGQAGTVTLGNGPLTIASWTPTRIESPAPESGGNLRVRIRGVKSNTIQLTEWRAQFTLTYHGRGSLQHRIVLNLNFWADIHSWRVLPHKPANFWSPRHLRTLSSSSCTFESSGEYRDRTDTSIVIERWEGAVTPLLSRTFTEPTLFGLGGQLDSVGRTSNLAVAFRGMFTRYLRGSGSSQETFDPPSELISISVRMTPAYTLPGGSIPWSSGENTATMTWGEVEALYPPDPSGGW